MPESEPHWVTIKDDRIVYAMGYCWCGDKDAPKHFIESRDIHHKRRKADG